MHRSRLAAVVIDCRTDDVDGAAAFWSRALGWGIDPHDDPDGSRYRRLDTPAAQPDLLVQAVEHPSRVHVDIETDNVEAEVRRLEALGARRVVAVKTWWVMEAPTGQRFCVVQPQRGDFAAEANVWE